MTLQDIRKEIDRLVDAGDESALEKFFLDCFPEFPEDIQRKVLLAFVADAVEKSARDQRIQQIQMKGLDALDKLQAFKASLSG